MPKETENMTINELIEYYIPQNITVLRGQTPSGGDPGTLLQDVTLDGANQNLGSPAKAWGQVSPGKVFLIKANGHWYALSSRTYQEEVIELGKRDFSKTERIKGYTQRGEPGAKITVTIDKPNPSQENHVEAIAWYEIPPGRAIVFSVDEKKYAISLVAPQDREATIC